MEQRFDPMTGEPIPQEETTEYANPSQQEQDYFGAMDQPVYVVPQMPQKSSKAVIGIVVAVVALVMILAGTTVALAAGGFFLSKPQKVARAIRNTFAEAPQFIKDLNFEEVNDMARNGDYTMDFEVWAKEFSVEGSFISMDKRKQLVGDLTTGEGFTADLEAEINEEELRVRIPLLSNDVFVYHYKEPVSEYMEQLLSQRGLTVEAWNQSLETLYSGSEQEADGSELTRRIGKELASLQWESVEKKSHVINGKSIQVQGYQVTVTRQDAEHIVQILDEYVLELNKAEDDTINAAFDTLYDACRDMPDVTCTFYVYKNKLASVFLEADNGYTCEWLIKGGDFCMQNMELIVSAGVGRTVSLQWDGKMRGAKEVYELSAYGMVLASFEYDTGSGRYELEVINDYLSVDGKLEKGKDQTGLTMNMGSDFSFGITYGKGAKPIELEGREKNMNEMSEEDWMDVMAGLDTF